MSLENNPVGKPLKSTNLEQKETPSKKKQIIRTVKSVGDKLITRSPSLDEELEKIKSESPATSTADSSPTFPNTQNFSCKEALLWKIRPSYSKKDKTVFDGEKKQYVQPMNYYTHGGQQEAKIKTHMQKHVANSLPDIVKEQEFRDRSEFQLCIKNNQLSFPQVPGTNPALLAEGEYKVIVSSEDNKGLSMYANKVNETKWDDPTRASHAKFLAGNPIFFGGKILMSLYLSY